MKPIIITSLKIKKPGQVKSLRDLCKYLQFRDGSVRREAFLGRENSGISIVQNSQGD